ncbi:hypothetical protein RDABS01_013638, partial [Bienertia sinuspersici]
DSYYHAYGKQRGFGVVREDVSYKQKAGRSTREKRAGVWRCNCWGKPDKRRVSNGKRLVVESPIQKSPINKTNSSKKCECPAMALILGGDENNTNANEEKEADANCWKNTRTLLTAFPFEAQFRDVYTDAKFKEVYYMYKVEHVKSKFILRHWMKDIQRKHMVVKVAYDGLSKTAQVQRFDKLMVEFELTLELTSNGLALTSVSANRSCNYDIVIGGTPNLDQSTLCQWSTIRTQNETASTSKGTTSHSGDPVLWRKKKGSKGGVNQQGLPMFGVGYRPGIVAQRLFANDPPLVQPLRQLCPIEPLFGCQLPSGNQQRFPSHPLNDGHFLNQPE